jgi:hypothetical protein
MKWIISIAIVVSVGVMAYFYVMLEKNAGDQSVVVQTATSSRSISIIHAYKDGEHRFVGQIKLPHSCYSLTSDASHDPKDPSSITVRLTSVDKMLDQTLCAKIPTNYPYQVVTDGPEKIEVHATLNDEDLGVRLTETDWQSSAGTYINPIVQ